MTDPTHIDRLGRVHFVDEMSLTYLCNAAASKWRWLLRHHRDHTHEWLDTARLFAVMLDELDFRGARDRFERMHMPPRREEFDPHRGRL